MNRVYADFAALRSIAADLVTPRSAHLVAAYAKDPGDSLKPAIDEIFTIDPPPERSIAGTTAFMPRKQPYWLIWMCCCQSDRRSPSARRAGIVDQTVLAPELLGGFDG